MTSLLSDADDRLHAPGPDASTIETVLFSFYVPEQGLGGWIYTFFRPQLGTMGGGCWVWDGSTTVPWEAPYFTRFEALPMPDGLDLRHAELPTGARLRVLEPLRRYQVGYHDPGLIEIDLEFEAIAPPHVAARGEPPVVNHFEQPGRVTGRLRLRDDELAIDCIAMRDRTWSSRPEGQAARLSYCWGAAGSGDGFLAIAAPVGDHSRIVHGYLDRAGVRHPLVEGTRREERNPTTPYCETIQVDAVDAAGRALHLVGASRTRLAVPMPGVARMVVWTSLVRWTDDGRALWGEDQDCFPFAQWSALAQRGAVAPGRQST